MNLLDPRVRVPKEAETQPGDFLHGTDNRVEFKVDLGFNVEIDHVYMDLEYVRRDGTPGFRRLAVGYDPVKDMYYADIDTTDMADGTITGKVTAVDTSGRSTTTTELVYNVKNMPPQIELTIPQVSGGIFDDALLEEGKRYDENEGRPVPLEPVYQGGSLIGIATDAFGVEAGYPQVMLWPAAGNNAYGTGSNSIPTSGKWAVWRAVLDDDLQPLVESGGLKAFQFRYPMVEPGDGELSANTAEEEDLLPGKYNFIIKTKDKFGNENVYPARSDHGPLAGAQPRYIQAELLATDSPIILIPSIKPYNGKAPFTVDITIRAKNALVTKRAAVTGSEDDEVIPFPGSDNIARKEESNTYTVTISAVEMMEMLGCSTLEEMSGDRILHVEVTDSIGYRTSTVKQFVIDTKAPWIDFIEPQGLPGSTPSLTSAVYIKGIARDNVRPRKMYYALGKTAVSEFGSDPDAPEWLEYDTLLDTDTPLDHHPNSTLDISWSGSLYNWKWRFDDISDLCTGAVQGGGNEYVDEYDFAAELWELPVNFLVEDTAGNRSITEITVIVDPLADLPKVEINSHENGQIVGGTVRLGGIARDNEIVHSMKYRVSADDGLSWSPGWTDITLGSRSPVVSWSVDINKGGEFSPPAGSTEGKAVLIEFYAIDALPESPNTPKDRGEPRALASLRLEFSNAAPDVYEVNIIHAGHDKWDDPAVIRRVYEYNSMVSDYITMEIKIRDGTGLKEINLRGQEKTAYDPLIDSTTPPGSPAPWVVKPQNIITAGGNIREGYKYLIMEESHYYGIFQSHDQKYNDVGLSFEAAMNGTLEGGKLMEANYQDADGRWSIFDYAVYVPLKTNGAGSIWNGRYNDSAGNYSFVMQLSNNLISPITNTESFSLAIDNYHPLASYSGYLNVMGVETISGLAWDTGRGITVFDTDTVVVYFSKPSGTDPDWEQGTPVPVRRGGTFESTDTQAVRVGRTGDTEELTNAGTLRTLPFFPKDIRNPNGGAFITSNDSCIVINADNLGKDSYTRVFSGSTVKTWAVNYDTRVNLDDGPLDVHYAVFDRAGNASHYVQRVYVCNNKPRIQYVDMGTDLDGNKSVTDGTALPGSLNEFMRLPISGSYIDSGFRARNDLFSVKTILYSGAINGDLHYKITYVQPGASPVSASTIVKGRVYTIVDTGNVEWRNYGVMGAAGVGVSFVATRNFPAGQSTNGTVTAYEPIANYKLTEKISPANENKVDFDHTNIGDSERIPYSITDKDGEGRPILNIGANRHLSRHFIVKVYDTTIQGAAEADQLADAVIVNIDIDPDTIEPNVKVSPFFWNSASDNSLLNNSKLFGHIELESDLPAAFIGTSANGLLDRDPKVSGQVSFRGTIYDNNTVGAIYFRFNKNLRNDYNSAAIGSYPATKIFNGVTYYLAAALNAGEWERTDREQSNGWKLIIEGGGLPNQEGHTVNWRLDFDSCFIVGVTSLDNILTIAAEDKKEPAANQSDVSQGSDKDHNYRFDIVPYISAVETEGASGGVKNINIRSADGRYSIMQAQSSIGIGSPGVITVGQVTVKGFNFQSPSAYILTSPQNTAYGSNPSSISGTSVSASSGNFTSFTINPDSSTKSGWLTVTVNGISSLNNINSNNSLGSYTLRLSGTGSSYQLIPNTSNGSDEENMPNREADRNITKNITLTDDRYLQFFAVKETNTPGRYPVMVIDPFTKNPVFGYIDDDGGPMGEPYAGNHDGSITGSRDSYWQGTDNNTGGAGVNEPTSGFQSLPQQAKTQRAEFRYETGGALYKEYLIKNDMPDQMAMDVDEAGRYGHYSVHNNGAKSTADYIYDRYAEINGHIVGYFTGPEDPERYKGNLYTDMNPPFWVAYTADQSEYWTHHIAGIQDTPIYFHNMMVWGFSYGANEPSGWSGYGADDTANFPTKPWSPCLTFEGPSSINSPFWYPRLIIKGNSIGTDNNDNGINDSLKVDATDGLIDGINANDPPGAIEDSYAANYLAYFDDATKNIYFRTFQVGTPKHEPNYRGNWNLSGSSQLNQPAGRGFRMNYYHRALSGGSPEIWGPGVLNATGKLDNNIDYGNKPGSSPLQKDIRGRVYEVYTNINKGSFYWYTALNGVAGVGLVGDYYDIANAETGVVHGGESSSIIRDKGRSIAAGGASKWFDMGVTDSNYVVIVYFVEGAGLRMKYSTGPIDGSQTGFTNTVVVSPVPVGGQQYGNEYQNYDKPIVQSTTNNNLNNMWNGGITGVSSSSNTGMYVSVCTDGSSVHIAAHDSTTGSLKYIYIPNYSTPGNRTEVIVDSQRNAGQRTEIKVHNGVPYIAYYNSLDAGSRDSIRIAYAKQQSSNGVSPGVDNNGYTTGAWEYMVVPAIQAPQGGRDDFRRVNLQFRNGEWVIGYLANNIEFSYPVGE